VNNIPGSSEDRMVVESYDLANIVAIFVLVVEPSTVNSDDNFGLRPADDHDGASGTLALEFRTQDGRQNQE
jgi:hypothetical protein